MADRRTGRPEGDPKPRREFEADEVTINKLEFEADKIGINKLEFDDTDDVFLKIEAEAEALLNEAHSPGVADVVHPHQDDMLPIADLDPIDDPVALDAEFPVDLDDDLGDLSDG